MVKRGNGHHMKSCRLQFEKTLSYDELCDKYINQQYSILDMSNWLGVPPTWVIAILRDFNIPQRKISEASVTERIKQKREHVNLERYGVPHNFCKSHPSRKRWESRLLNEEGITNVFQRQSVKEKIKRTMLQRYGTDWKYQRSKSSDINYYISKYGKDEGERRYRQVCYEKGKFVRVSHYVELYGEEDGVKLYRKMLSNRHIGAHWDGLNKKCKAILGELRVQYETEFALPSENYAYRYDIKINNLLIELNGIYWHCSPKKYKPNDLIKFPNNKFILAKDKWDYDKTKNEWAIQNGYKIEVIWEDELNKELVKSILRKHNINFYDTDSQD